MKVLLIDEYPPETTAMLQALYSRSSASVTEHIDRVRAKGSAGFMRSYYVGYGHSSIGDCGNTTIFIENVSLLACKAVQNTSLYQGQETSTRYIDFSASKPVDPVNNSASQSILLRWLNFYGRVVSEMKSDLHNALERPADITEMAWEKAINARAFDVARGFLPAGVTSQLSWSTTLRHAHDHLLRLHAHPLAEVREIARSIQDALKQKYPSSFGHEVPTAVTEYIQRAARAEEYFDTDLGRQWTATHAIRRDALDESTVSLLNARPRRAALPKELDRLGYSTYYFQLDFGSFRDLQRHRNGICRMPLLSGRHGFHEWYLDQLRPAMQQEALGLIEAQSQDIKSFGREQGVDDAQLQYYWPLGMKVPCELTYSLRQATYVAELRSGVTVHPTLRTVAKWMGDELLDQLPSMQIYIDESQDSFQVKRGSQDIVPLELHS